jgi:phosphoribosylaminoimidazole-succinocarboxamide synthase
VISTAALPLIYAGKVRRLYALDNPNQVLIVATDAISAYDQVLATPIPDKGAILTQLSVWWSEQLKDIVPGHVIATDVPSDVQGRAVICERLEMIPIECVARGFITGSGWAEYQVSGTVAGLPLPSGLQHADRLPQPIFTPATKAPQGEHDENISFEQLVQIVGPDLAGQLRSLTLALFARGSRIAAERGIILADTKFEFGRRPDGTVVLADEVLTPDSSRFWDAAQYHPGAQVPSFDKQYIRDWLAYDSGWDKNSDEPPPPLPRVVVQATRDRYLEAYARLTGRQFAPPRSPSPSLLVAAGSTAATVPLTKYVVDVMPKPEILDPQGKAITGALGRLGYEGFAVRQGKRFEIETTRPDEDATAAQVYAFAEAVLANPVIETFTIWRGGATEGAAWTPPTVEPPLRPAAQPAALGNRRGPSDATPPAPAPKAAEPPSPPSEPEAVESAASPPAAPTAAPRPAAAKPAAPPPAVDSPPEMASAATPADAATAPTSETTPPSAASGSSYSTRLSQGFAAAAVSSLPPSAALTPVVPAAPPANPVSEAAFSSLSGDLAKALTALQETTLALAALSRTAEQNAAGASEANRPRPQGVPSTWGPVPLLGPAADPSAQPGPAGYANPAPAAPSAGPNGYGGQVPAAQPAVPNGYASQAQMAPSAGPNGYASQAPAAQSAGPNGYAGQAQMAQPAGPVGYGGQAQPAGPTGYAGQAQMAPPTGPAGYAAPPAGPAGYGGPAPAVPLAAPAGYGAPGPMAPPAAPAGYAAPQYGEPGLGAPPAGPAGYPAAPPAFTPSFSPAPAAPTPRTYRSQPVQAPLAQPGHQAHHPRFQPAPQPAAPPVYTGQPAAHQPRPAQPGGHAPAPGGYRPDGAPHPDGRAPHYDAAPRPSNGTRPAAPPRQAPPAGPANPAAQGR